MFSKHALFFLTFIFTGCGLSEMSDKYTYTDADTNADTSWDDATPTGDSTPMQTMEVNEFSFQFPADWVVLKKATAGTPNVAVSSPFDLSNPGPQVTVVASILPLRSERMTSKDAMSSLLKHNKSTSNVESEVQTTVSGLEAIKLVTTSLNEPKLRTVYFYIPCDAGVLLVNATAPDEQVVKMMPQIDAIVASLKLK